MKIFIWFSLIAIISAIKIEFESKPKKCNQQTFEIESIFESTDECLKKKWEPSTSLVKRLLPKGMPKLFGNRSVYEILSSVNILPNVSLSLPQFVKKWIPKNPFKKSENSSDIEPRARLPNMGELNEMTCCMMFETVCVTRKVVNKSSVCSLFLRSNSN